MDTFNASRLVRQLRSRLVAQRGNFPKLVRSTYLSLSWLSKFASGHEDNPRVRTLETLDKGLRKLEEKE